MVDVAEKGPRAEPDRQVNEVRLVGRASMTPVERVLPSGDTIVSLRVVVKRPAVPHDGRTRVDAIDVVCWTARARRSAKAVRLDETIEVSGALRRRFWRGRAGVASLCEVEATRVRRLRRST